MNLPNYKRIPHLLLAISNCERADNTEWIARHSEVIERIMSNAPSGSGFDSGTTLNRDKTNSQRLVLETSFHHMNQDGYYDGWTEHTVRVWADLTSDFRLTISGRDHNDIKDLIAETFDYWLREESP